MLAGLLHARMGMRTTSQQTDDFLAYGPEMNAMVFNKLSGQVLFEEKNQVLFKEKNQVLFEEKNQVLFEEKNQVLFEEKNQVLFEEKNQVLFEEKNQVLFEEKAQEVERSSRNYLEVMDAQHQDLLSAEPGLLRDQDRHRRNGARPGSKVRHKRQALQDMARPLKQWLYSHRENPYPTKTEKILLALGSHMTLVQVSNWFANARRRLKNTVSNWFANARRRLKNTVRQPDLSWALRIKLYNRYVQGNAERLSVSSEDSGSQDAELAQRTQGPEELDEPLLFPSVIKHEASSRSLGLDPGLCGLDPGLCGLDPGLCGLDPGLCGLDPGLRGPDPEDCVTPPPKYKSSLLHRYLNDSLRHVMVARRLSDHAHFVCRAETADHGLRQSKCDNHGAGGHMVKAQKDATYWREINAAMALTNLAHSSEGPGTRTRTRDQEPGTRTRTRDQEPGTTSCIIQKSSHIAEIKTVKVPLMETY